MLLTIGFNWGKVNVIRFPPLVYYYVYFLKMIKRKNSFFKSTEEAISMFLGLAIVIVVVGLVINFFNSRKKNAKVPGVENNIELSETGTNGTKTITGGEYIVVKGDNLWKIAVMKYNDGYKWVDIAKANKLKSAGYVEVGQKLILPELTVKTAVTAESKPATTITGGSYVVVRNDSLWKIAVAKYNDGYKWMDIYKANKTLISNPNKIEIGMTLVLP